MLCNNFYKYSIPIIMMDVINSMIAWVADITSIIIIILIITILIITILSLVEIIVHFSV